MSRFSNFFHPDVDDLKRRGDVERLWRMFDDNDPKHREQKWLAEAALVDIGPPAIPKLIRVLTSPDNVYAFTSSHDRAYLVLEEMGELAIRPLVALLDDRDGVVRKTARMALSDLGRRGVPGASDATALLADDITSDERAEFETAWRAASASAMAAAQKRGGPATSPGYVWLKPTDSKFVRWLRSEGIGEEITLGDDWWWGIRAPDYDVDSIKVSVNAWTESMGRTLRECFPYLTYEVMRGRATTPGGSWAGLTEEDM